MSNTTQLWMMGVLFLLAGCNASSRTDGGPRREVTVEEGARSEIAPHLGHDGTVPSPAAQAALGQLKGRRFQPAGGSLGTDELVIVDGSLEVIPNPITGKGPVILLERPGTSSTPLSLSAKQGDGGRFWLPVVTDGDAADLIRRVAGAAATGLSGPTSEAYTRTIAGP